MSVNLTGTSVIALATLLTNAQTGTTYTFALTDANNTVVEFNNAGAITATVPSEATIAFPVGSQIQLLQTGAGQVTVVGATSPNAVTVNATPGLKLRAQWSSATLVKRATNTWVLMGDVSA